MNDQNFKPLDIRSDPVFKAVFTKEIPAAKNALSNLVSALIGRKITVIHIMANEQPINGINDRKIRYDIKCKAENGELINVEMGLHTRAYEPLRMEFYTGRLFSSQEISGKGKTYSDLKETYQISILAKRSFINDDVFLHTFEYYDPEHKISLNGKTRIITLELCKLDSIVEKPTEKMSLVERWAIFFEYLQNEEKHDKIKEIVNQEEGIAMANEVLMKISAEEKERYRLMEEEDEIMTYYSDLEEAIMTGEQKKSLEVARNALAEGYSIDSIQRITGLDMETIASL